MTTLLEESKLKDIKINLLEHKINKLEQYFKRKNIEIIYISPEKDPLAAILYIADKIVIHITQNDVKNRSLGQKI